MKKNKTSFVGELPNRLPFATALSICDLAATHLLSSLCTCILSVCKQPGLRRHRLGRPRPPISPPTPCNLLAMSSAGSYCTCLQSRGDGSHTASHRLCGSVSLKMRCLGKHRQQPSSDAAVLRSPCLLDSPRVTGCLMGNKTCALSGSCSHRVLLSLRRGERSSASEGVTKHTAESTSP